MWNRNLEVRSEDLDNRTIVYTLSGFLGGSAACYEFQDQVRQKVADGKKKILVDLADIKRIDSSGIGILVAIMWSASSAGGGLALVALQPHVEKVLSIAMLLDHITHGDTLEEALAKLSEMNL